MSSDIDLHILSVYVPITDVWVPERGCKVCDRRVTVWLEFVKKVRIMAESDRDDSGAVLVGRLIRSYRDEVRRNGRRLTQEGLLDLMVEQGEDSAAYWDRSMISNWERGVRHPPREFLVSFGRALDVPQTEMDHMLALAGYESLDDEEGHAALLAAAQAIESQVESLEQRVRGLVDSVSPHRPAVDASAVAKGAMWRLAPAGVYALVVGFILNALGQNGTLALLAYTIVALAIVVGQWAIRWLNPDRTRTEHDNIVDLFFISLFFTSNTSVLIGALMKADHFGFYTIEAFTNTPMPFLFATLAHLVISLIASVMFSVLWRRQYSSEDFGGTFSRAVWTTLPPLLFAYASIVLFTNLAVWMSFMVIYGVLFGTFTIIVALNDPEMTLADSDFFLKAAIVVITLLTVFGVIAVFISYLEPNVMATVSELRIIPLRPINAEELGYTPEQGMQYFRFGSAWMALANIVYLTTVVGGYLLVTIRRAAP